jgi:hypothetical protein
LIRDSIVPQVANDTQLPQLCWSLIDVVQLPLLFRQSIAAGAAADAKALAALIALAVALSSSAVTTSPKWFF